MTDLLSGWRRLAAAGAVLLVCGATPAAQAQSAADVAAGSRNAERIQREQDGPDGPRGPRVQGGAPAQVVVTAPAPAAPATAPGCMDVARIDLDGAAHLPAAAWTRISAAYAGRCLGLADIEQLLADVVAAYVAGGRIAARAYVRSQDLSQGRLQVLVLEGALDSISVDDGAARSVSVEHLFPGLLGQPLNLRDLEQGLDQLNRLESNYATLQVQPGGQAGGSSVVLRNEPLAPVRLTLSADNLGDRSTGRHRLGARLTVDNPFGVNDYLSISHRRALPDGVAGNASSASSALYELPYGYSTFSAGAGRSTYSGTLFTASGQAFASHGDSSYGFARAGRVVYRDQSRRASVATTLTIKNASNYLDDHYLYTSSRKLAVWDNDASVSLRGRYGVLWAQLGVSVGLDHFGALRDTAGREPGAPRAQFCKLRYDAAYTLPFHVGQTEALFTSDLNGQRGIDVLYGSEQILVGGMYSVRGYGNSVFIGDSGFTVRNELAASLPWRGAGRRGAVLQPYLGVDYGRVFMRGPDSFGGYLSGAAAGVRLDMGAWGAEVFAARPLDMTRGAPREGARLSMQLRLVL